jgi:hypothetical protein
MDAAGTYATVEQLDPAISSTIDADVRQVAVKIANFCSGAH